MSERFIVPAPHAVSDVSTEIALDCGHLLTISVESGVVEMALTDAHGKSVPRGVLCVSDIRTLQGVLAMLDALNISPPAGEGRDGVAS